LFQPELAGRGLVWAGLVVLVLVGRLGVGHDRLSAGGVLAGEDEQGAQQGGGLAGVDVGAGEAPPVLEVAEAVLYRPAGSGQDLVGLALGGVVLRDWVAL
jgi:hypothetical protein